ncbi:MAG: hypothetical protein VB122_08510 [Erysipelotrichales bacterium]|nr:hypothetical protein [Erysipelotrichales bacterium]
MKHNHTDTNHEIYEHDCEKCSSRLRVVIPHQDEHDEAEEYYCPVCKSEYTVRASGSPEVTVIEKDSSQ